MLRGILKWKTQGNQPIRAILDNSSITKTDRKIYDCQNGDWTGGRSLSSCINLPGVWNKKTFEVAFKGL
jgi:hypothetical protein